MESDKMDKFEKAKAFIQTFLSSITEKSLPQLKLFLKNLEKDLAAAGEGTLLSQYTSVTEMLNHTVEGKGKAALHFACARGDVDIVRYLIEEYHPDIHLKDTEKNTPFLTSIQHGHLSLVKYFVEQLGQPANSGTDGEVTGLHVAANNNFGDIIEYLLSKGADIQRVSLYGKPLNWAVGSNQTQAALLLLEKGANPNGDASGVTPAPLILAIDFGNEVLYKKLIEKGADLNVKDPKGYSLLHLVCEKGNLTMVKFLIEKGLDPNYEAEGKSSYYLAFESNQFEVVEYLKTILNKQKIHTMQERILTLKKKSEESKISKEESDKKSLQFKNKGNTFYADKKYEEAIEQYTQAIEVDPQNNILYSNRAAAYLALKNYPKALEDCQAAKKINPNHIKTLVREGQAYAGVGNFLEAAVSFWQALKIQPNNKEVFGEFNKCSQIAKAQAHSKQ